jgi:glycine/D-amino acid oxidase-like deaminating enzyme
VIRLGLQKGMNLQTYTPATGLQRAQGGRWTVTTSRGTITTPVVVCSTNAYTSSFLPEFKKLIIPIRGTACSITPAPNYSPGGARGRTPYTFGFFHGQGDVDYMIPRQGRKGVTGHGDQSIILGGAKSCFVPHLERWYDNINDDELMPGVKEYFEGFMKKHFVGWDGNEHGNVDRVWSGGESTLVLTYHRVCGCKDL